MFACRNESYQEDLWGRSFEYLRDHLSPETVEKYGPTQEPTTTEQATEVEGEMTATAIVENSGEGETITEQAPGTGGDVETTAEQEIEGEGGETTATDTVAAET